jgi:hypothetical protein
MAARSFVRWREDGKDILISEADVTRLRRDAGALKSVKQDTKLPKHPGHGESMPRNTPYVGDPPTPLPRTRPPIGNPLIDQGRRG